MSDVDDALIERGHDLTGRLRGVEADLSAWLDEIPASRPEFVDAQMHVEQALSALNRARTAIGVFTQIAAEMAPSLRVDDDE